MPIIFFGMLIPNLPPLLTGVLLAVCLLLPLLLAVLLWLYGEKWVYLPCSLLFVGSIGVYVASCAQHRGRNMLIYLLSALCIAGFLMILRLQYPPVFDVLSRSALTALPFLIILIGGGAIALTRIIRVHLRKKQCTVPVEGFCTHLLTAKQSYRGVSTTVYCPAYRFRLGSHTYEANSGEYTKGNCPSPGTLQPIRVNPLKPQMIYEPARSPHETRMKVLIGVLFFLIGVTGIVAVAFTTPI